MNKTIKGALLWSLAFLLTVAVFTGAAAQTLGGCAFLDTNGDGTREEGEALITGVPIRLFGERDDGWFLSDELTTDAYGYYAFNDLAEGPWRVVCPLRDQSGCAFDVAGSREIWQGGVASAEIRLAEDRTDADIALEEPGILSLQVYVDKNVNGMVDKREKGLEGATLRLFRDGEEIAVSQTDVTGTCTLFAASGTYEAVLTLPAGYQYTPLGEQNDFTAELSAEAHLADVVLQRNDTRILYAAVQTAGAFSGRVFEDMNNNGIMDEGEPGVPDVRVYLTHQKSGTKYTTLSDENGEYAFSPIGGGAYLVRADLPEGMLFARYSQSGGNLRSIFTGSNLERKFVVKQGAVTGDKNIGVVQKGHIEGLAFLDQNYNGRYDEGEPGVPGVAVEALKIPTGDSMGKAVSGKDGTYVLENIRGGSYRVRAVVPDDGAIFSRTAAGAFSEVNGFEQRGIRRESFVQPVEILSGGTADVLVGVARGATLTGTVFQDADYDGILGKKEKALSGVKVRLTDEAGVEIAAGTTNKNGVYTLTGILPGRYILKVQRKADFGFTRLRAGQKGGNVIASLEGSFGSSEPIEVHMGETLSDLNAGMLPAATLSGVFWLDENDNGVREPSEGGMTRAQVRLLSDDGEIDLVQTPGADGSFFFDGVMPGDYTLECLLPDQTEMAKRGSGTYDALQHVSVAMGEKRVLEPFGGVVLGGLMGNVTHGSEPLPGAEIVLKPRDGEAVSVKSAADGTFEIRNLRPDDYTLTVTLPEGLIFAEPLPGLPFGCEESEILSASWETLTDRMPRRIDTVRPAVLTGTVWVDENKDTLRGADEIRMQGLTVSLTDEEGAEVQTLVTGDKDFRFGHVRPGRYVLCFDLPEGTLPAGDAGAAFRRTGDRMATEILNVAEGEERAELSCGVVCYTAISGRALLSEGGKMTPVKGMTVRLCNAEGKKVSEQQTDDNGLYRFDELWPGMYRIESRLPADMIFVRGDDPEYPAGSTVIVESEGSRGTSGEIALKMSRNRTDMNILLIKTARIGDRVWLDRNSNGLVDADEPGIAGVRIYLEQNGEVVGETVSDVFGYWQMDRVYPGTYVLAAESYLQLEITAAIPELRIISSCLVSGDGTRAVSDSFRAVSGSVSTLYKMGFTLKKGESLPEEALPEQPLKDWTLSNTPRE